MNVLVCFVLHSMYSHVKFQISIFLFVEKLLFLMYRKLKEILKFEFWTHAEARSPSETWVGQIKRFIKQEKNEFDRNNLGINFDSIKKAILSFIVESWLAENQLFSLYML